MGSKKRGFEGRDPSRQSKIHTRDHNTTAYVQVLGTGMDTHDTSPSVLLFFDHHRFIFNAGEGLQRFCTEHKIKLSKIDHMFLTRVCSETAGGIPGLLLTIAGMGETGMSVDIWGPSDLKYLVDAMQCFIPNATMIHTHSFGATTSSSETLQLKDPIVLIDNEVVKISAILLRPSYSRGPGDVMESKENASNFSGPLTPCSQGVLDKTTSTLKPGDLAVIYTCELPEIKGKFRVDLANDLGVPPSKRGQLQRGESVILDSTGKEVTPSQVLEPSTPGPVVLIVDCPTPWHMLELFSLQGLSCYYVDDTGVQRTCIKSVSCIIHLGPTFITRSSEYQKWMKRFGCTQHIMTGHEIKNMEFPIFKSSARIQSRLNYLCPQLFPAPGYRPLEQTSYSLESNREHERDSSSDLYKTVSAGNLLKFLLRPFKAVSLDQSAVPSLYNHTEIINELLSEIPEIAEVSKLVSQFWQSPLEGKQNRDIPACLENITREDMEIILLGTGSSQPSKYRNVSAILVNLFSKGTLLLDCGEGTLAQLRIRFGVEGADDAVKRLKCIWISHIHADHHSGLARVLSFRSQLLKGIAHEPLIVVGPRQMKGFLDAYCILEDLDMQFLDCIHTTKDSFDDLRRSHDSNDEAILLPVLGRFKEMLYEAGLETLYSVPVIHCYHAFGVVLKAAERVNSLGEAIPGWKMVYSGDTRPCQSMIDASCDATVLIHEATFEDGMEEDAAAKNHSTTSQALRVGESAGAYRVILTHFSQRYPKIPVVDGIHMDKACIAFDLMSVNVADLPLLPKLLPCLKVLFKNEMVADESR